jgi:hypothetical protein
VSTNPESSSYSSWVTISSMCPPAPTVMSTPVPLSASHLPIRKTQSAVKSVTPPSVPTVTPPLAPASYSSSFYPTSECTRSKEAGTYTLARNCSYQSRKSCENSGSKCLDRYLSVVIHLINETLRDTVGFDNVGRVVTLLFVSGVAL